MRTKPRPTRPRRSSACCKFIMMTPDWPYRREVLCVQTETRVRPSCGALGTTACGAAIYLGEVFACRASEECECKADRGAAETVTRAVTLAPQPHTTQCVVVSRRSVRLCPVCEVCARGGTIGRWSNAPRLSAHARRLALLVLRVLSACQQLAEVACVM